MHGPTSVFIATVAAASVAALPSRRASTGGLCFSRCNPVGGRRTGFLGSKCACLPSFTGNCCNDELPCDELDVQTADLDLAEFTRASWFTQWQQTTPFEPEESLFCVNAAFDVATNAPGKAEYTARNSGNLNKVNGDLNGATACFAESGIPGKLLFAPCPVFALGGNANPFWVLDVGLDSEGKYEWAIITGGPPTERLDDGKCGTRNGVFALITRNKVATHNQLQAMNNALTSKGLSTNLLVKVEQEGCNYDGIRLKNGVNDGPGPIPPTSFGPAPIPPTVAESCDSIKPLETFPLDVNEFVRASWFTQFQQEDDFQKKEDFFCTSATYDFTSAGPPGASITASNFGRNDAVDGEVSGIVLCAGSTDVKGKLKVAPCPVFTFAAGDFWVLEAGVDASTGHYDWAIVVAGQPEEFVADDGKCTATRGLFLNTRNPNPPQATIAAMFGVLARTGISAGKLFPVTQEDCNYDWRIKGLPGVDAGPGPAPPTSFGPTPGSTGFELCPNGRPRGTPGADCDDVPAGPPSGPPSPPSGPPAGFVLCPNGRPRGTPGADC